MKALQPPNGLRYPRVGGTRQRQFAGTNFKPRKTLENAQTPTSRVDAVLARCLLKSDTQFDLRIRFSLPFFSTMYTCILQFKTNALI
jgi:hypothetical protein